MLLKEYLQDPCRSLSIPYWKAKTIRVPKDMLILHDDHFREFADENYHDETFFRLYHNMENIRICNVEGFRIVTASLQDIEEIVHIINRSYTDIQVTGEQIKGYTKTAVYQPALWILVQETMSGKAVGCGIADYDREARELILEWIQVLPAYRGNKIGQLIVNEMLGRMKGIAAFATVSGKVNNPTNPERMYRKCGFSGNDIWHVLRKVK